MTFLLISFLAGVLTVLAPCTLPLLPIIVGRTADAEGKYRPLIITGSLAVAIVAFTLLLKASTAFINIPPSAWAWLSGSIIIMFGLISLFPNTWKKISLKCSLSRGSSELLQKSSQKKGVWGDILVGLSLGPVFSSCSPTYFLILATVLPQSYGKGVVYLIAYAIGLALMLLLIGYIGQKLVKKLSGVSDPHGKFKRGLGVLFILVGLFIITGTDKKIQTYILDNGVFDITKVEQLLLTEPMTEEMGVDVSVKNNNSTKNYPKYKEIADPAGFVNSEPFQLADLVGKKVILLDILTYSCINCQRTFPYLNTWYETYHDAGLEIVGIHTPEFAFEHKKENVQEAAERFGLKFPLVLDNNYGTWNAYGNRYWPRKYLIDIDGNIVYDHIGEGGYDETEMKIQELLKERNKKLGETMDVPTNISANSVDAEQVDVGSPKSPESYVGAARSTNPDIAKAKQNEVVTFERPTDIQPNRVYLVGDWIITDEYAEAASDNASILYNYSTQKVFLVMGHETNARAKILLDTKPISAEAHGSHVNDDGTVTIESEQLYRLIEHTKTETHLLEIKMETGIQAFAFTFG
ncbi:MAG: cytochrome C biogenesis protein [Candidatus Magasanikbacteria bacterium CG_4_9_14_0_2_um_filter_42_11]|uniref:Cytochrome C biogenesis protein n=1 Tax=Candidatus Magasanikbacteria bacterium CG_4_9_14_0_2_um_filter_42_11 TaxID=1974643 RepID=A0A2M8F957_9BACT|nr:MAG: cytochrome C biogenesis protein [Candidatus Magasanikbacteria bacterium CG_4_10_14_0_8_um_filter_42_12]PJC52267.1 MAG: cytochrome C biogenesis protein [Candidatus Magasanikbacteria bacterium CG_4_9_14_0_2_um_filter_42_11]